MKNIHIVLSMSLLSVSTAMGQICSLVATAPVGGIGVSTTLTIQTNQVARVLHSYMPPDANPEGDQTRTPKIEVSISTNTFEYVGDLHPVIAGPATIQIKVDNSNTYFQTPCSVYTTIQIADNEPQFSPSTAVVIPVDATGPVNIVLESSPDLVNWTGALPGTYGSSSTNRFFRVRAIHQ